MILSNVEIHKALDDGRLVIDPEPLPRFPTVANPESPYASTTIDLGLDDYYALPPVNPGQLVVDLSQPGEIKPTLNIIYANHSPLPAEGYLLRRNEFVLMQTLETVHLKRPEDFEGDAVGRPALAARVEGRSSLARLGILVHFTAPTIQNGFGPGKITLEVICMGSVPIRLWPGVPICQLVIEEVLGDPLRARDSQFQHQTTPMGK